MEGGDQGRYSLLSTRPTLTNTSSAGYLAKRLSSPGAPDASEGGLTLLDTSSCAAAPYPQRRPRLLNSFLMQLDGVYDTRSGPVKDSCYGLKLPFRLRFPSASPHMYAHQMPSQSIGKLLTFQSNVDVEGGKGRHWVRRLQTSGSNSTLQVGAASQMSQSTVNLA